VCRRSQTPSIRLASPESRGVRSRLARWISCRFNAGEPYVGRVVSTQWVGLPQCRLNPETCKILASCTIRGTFAHRACCAAILQGAPTDIVCFLGMVTTFAFSFFAFTFAQRAPWAAATLALPATVSPPRGAVPFPYVAPKTDSAAPIAFSSMLSIALRRRSPIQPSPQSSQQKGLFHESVEPHNYFSSMQYSPIFLSLSGELASG